MKSPQIWVGVGLAVLLVSCASDGGSPEGWSRTYLATFDRVFDTAIDVLEEKDYLVDADRRKGRISASPSSSKGSGFAALDVRITQTNSRVRVDALARTGAAYMTMTSRPSETAVLEFFHELEQRLRVPDA
ncbi:MAG: hypothetical protein P8127_07075 [Acidobacteriota bacterium]|jgi:hypothetical protein